MPLFTVVTRSTFENVYVVEAVNLQEAEQKVSDGTDFFQKHLGEPIRKVKRVKKGVTLKKIQSKIRKRGYW